MLVGLRRLYYEVFGGWPECESSSFMTAGKHSPSSAREIVENVVGRRIEERVGRIPSEPHGAGFVWVAGQRPNVGYRLIAAREDDVVTPLQACDVPGQVGLRFPNIQHNCRHDLILDQIHSLYEPGGTASHRCPRMQLERWAGSALDSFVRNIQMTRLEHGCRPTRWAHTLAH